jgi:hypothetical protein
VVGTSTGSILLPLNVDAYTFQTFNGPPVFSNFIGLLDASGIGSASLTIPPNALSPSLVGIELDHAALTFDGVFFTSTTNAVAFELGA